MAGQRPATQACRLHSLRQFGKDTMKIARIAIFLTGMMGLAIGGITSISSLQSQQEETVLRTNDSLKSQAQMIVDQYFGIMDAAKNASNPTALAYVTAKAIVKMDKGAPTQVESITQANNESDLSLEDRLMKSLKQQISLGDLQTTKQSLGTYELSDLGTKEGMFVATPIYKTITDANKNVTTDPNTIEKISVVLIDPAKAFAGLGKVNSERNAYFMDKKGKVLAHSLSAYIGTDLRKIDHLKDTIDNLFLGAQTGSVGQYQAVDGTKEHVAFVRAGISPFAVGVEQKTNAPVLSGAWIVEQMHSGAARKNLGVIFIMIGIALALFSGISLWLGRELRKQIATNSTARATKQPKEEPSPFVPATAPFEAPAYAQATAKPSNPQSPSKVAPSFFASSIGNDAVAQAASSFVENRQSIQKERETAKQSARAFTVNRDFVKEFHESVEKNGYTLEAVEQALVQNSSELSESPVLYFRYQRRSQNLTLASVAGKVQIPNYSYMQAYVRKDIEMQVESLANEGKVASVTNYAPLSKLMMQNLNVAHFEAWAITSDSEVSSGSKLMGVLVILQAGFRSAQARPTLAKVLREGGNYLYAQSNKIQPRTPAGSPNAELES